MFLKNRSNKLDNYTIYPVWRLTLNHALLTIIISIFKEHVQTKKYTIVKNSKEKGVFVKELIEAFKNTNMSNLSNVEQLENVILSLAISMERIWGKEFKNCQYYKALQELVEYIL